jgi:hypothetical protein
VKEAHESEVWRLDLEGFECVVLVLKPSPWVCDGTTHMAYGGFDLLNQRHIGHFVVVGQPLPEGWVRIA